MRREYFLSTAAFCVLLAFAGIAGCSSSGREGAVVFTSSRSGKPQLYLMRPDGKGQKRLLKSAFSDESPWWSPDGSKIVFASNRTGKWDLFSTTHRGASPVQLTRESGDNRNPAWSPDGSLIAFQTDRRGSWEIFLMEPDGSGQRPLMKTASGDRPGWMMPAWYSESRALAIVREHRGVRTIWKADVKTGKSVPVTRTSKHDMWPSLGPAGDTLLFASDESDHYQVYLYDEKEKSKLMLTSSNPDPDNTQPRWAPGGNGFLFVSSTRGNRDIYRLSLSNGGKDGKKYLRAKALTTTRHDDYDPCWCPVSAPGHGKRA